MYDQNYNHKLIMSLIYAPKKVFSSLANSNDSVLVHFAILHKLQNI